MAADLGVFVGAAASMYAMYRRVFPPEPPRPRDGRDIQVKPVLWFAAAVTVIVLVSGSVLAIPFSSAGDRSAIAASAAVAVVVQLFAFAIARVTAKSSFFAGWTIGIVLRFATLIVYAFVAVKGLAMPAPAALISLVMFLFLTTLVEPKLLAL